MIRLLRQDWPKGADLRRLTVTACDHLALRLNTCLRKTLGRQSPRQALHQWLDAAAL